MSGGLPANGREDVETEGWSHGATRDVPPKISVKASNTNHIGHLITPHNGMYDPYSHHTPSPGPNPASVSAYLGLV